MALHKWAVVGAGPAGLAAVGALLDNGVAGRDIVWIDPHFDVGLLGRKWRSVSSNTPVSLFDKFLLASPAFGYARCPQSFDLHAIPADDTCALQHIVEPLEWVTKQLRSQVDARMATVAAVKKCDVGWALELANSEATVTAQRVVLAIGSRPREMTLERQEVAVVPLDEALQVDVLKARCQPDDTVAVFGSSHSAIMIVRDLLQDPSVRAVVNFHRAPALVFAERAPSGEFINDSTGLKGKTAAWARKHMIEGSRPENLHVYPSTPAVISEKIGACTKAIFAIGFEREDLKIDIECPLAYNDQTSEIAPGLFGVGIAYPERRADAVGNVELQVGLWKFMTYITRVAPTVWLAKQ